MLTAYSPLGSPGILAKPDTPAPLKDPKITEVAKKHGKTAAQTILRYLASFKEHKANYKLYVSAFDEILLTLTSKVEARLIENV